MLVVALGMGATGFACWWTWREAERRDRERFGAHVEAARQLFDAETEKYEQALNGVREWMGWVETPSLAEWENRLDRMDIRGTFPGVARIGYAPFSAQMDRWRGRIPKHWPALWPNGYLPETRDRLAYDTRVGEWKDWTTEPPVMQAAGEGDVYSAAYQSGGMKSTKRILLRRSDGSKLAAFRAWFAVFADEELPPPNAVPTGPTPRHVFRGRLLMNAFVGAVVAEVALEPLLNQMDVDPQIELELYAGAVVETNRLNRLDQTAFGQSPAYRTGLHRDYEVPWYGERWTLAFRPTANFHLHSNHGRVWWVGGTGFALTLAVAGFLWVEGQGRLRAESLSTELSRARDDLRTVQTARQQLQRNLHDAVLQRLYAAALHARQTWQTAVRGEPVATEELATQVSELDAAMADLRSFLGGPAQRELSEAELASALRGLAQAFSRQTGVAVRLDAAPATLAELPLEARAQLLPMVREGLSNAWRHGHASEITLAATNAADAVTVTVTDNGGGFDPTSNTPGGHGLKNLAERAAQSGGTFRVESQTGGPTTLCFEWKGGGDDATA